MSSGLLLWRRGRRTWTTPHDSNERKSSALSRTSKINERVAVLGCLAISLGEQAGMLFCLEKVAVASGESRYRASLTGEFIAARAMGELNKRCDMWLSTGTALPSDATTTDLSRCRNCSLHEVNGPDRCRDADMRAVATGLRCNERDGDPIRLAPAKRENRVLRRSRE